MNYRILFFFLIPLLSFSQDDLLSEIDSDSIGIQYESATFKGLKIVNFESTKLVAHKELTFIVSHRFGTLKDGINTFFGLDNAVTRLNFVYGITDGINIGISRSSGVKVYDITFKYIIAKQVKNGFPFTIVGFNALIFDTGLSDDIYPLLEFKDRMGYTSQILIARKINTNLSLQLSPTVFHDNFVVTDEQNNTQYALGIGGRYKLNKRWSLNLDYGLHLNRADTSPFKNPLSIGFDLETGGHVFQMHLTNAQQMYTNGFLGQGAGDWGDGNIFFGFNLSRRF
ncbi:DUF5777 family beta-barrel protein [Seonamhaeicola sp. ML3]|uniref:DUF5777 family beta-barrel protein n=1 Tax=Seonamhaeicola sp. ML3 TaxID=2937786 RepID=UPI00200C2B2D|nr:DUF5777 family beta-barrel protein [Seonamhaeicola sp. ML3]